MCERKATCPEGCWLPRGVVGVWGCPGVLLPPEGHCVPLQFGRDLHGGKHDWCQELRAGGRRRCGGTGGKRHPWEGSSPPTPHLGNSGGCAWRPAGGWAPGPGLHFPYCPSALMYAVLSLAPCASVCVCVCVCVQPGVPRRVEAHSLMRAGTERQHCSFPRTPGASRSATCEPRPRSGASTPGTPPHAASSAQRPPAAPP